MKKYGSLTVLKDQTNKATLMRYFYFLNYWFDRKKLTFLIDKEDSPS